MNKLNKIFLGVIVVLMLVLFFASYIYNNIKINRYSRIYFIKVPYANQTIISGVQIINNMISYREVPNTFLIENYYSTIEDIVGKCVRNDTSIIESSLFYEELLVDCQYIDNE